MRVYSITYVIHIGTLTHVPVKKNQPKRLRARVYIVVRTLFFFVCEIVSVFDRQYRVIGLGTVPKLPGRIIYLARANTHSHPPAHARTHAAAAALQSNSQFSARFIPGMIAGRSRRKIGRYTHIRAVSCPPPRRIYTSPHRHRRTISRV